MTRKIMNKIAKDHSSNKMLYAVIAVVAIILAVDTFYIFTEIKAQNPDPVTVIGLMIANLVIVLAIGVFLLSNRVNNAFAFIKKGRKRVSRLRRRIIIGFSLGAAVPTIIVAIFSTYFFNFGIQAWFDSKISKVLDQSILVGRSYIGEHKLQLKQTAISVADDLSAMYYDLIHDTESFTKVLNAQAEMRSLDEAIVFQKNTNTIIAQTSLSFSLSFATIPLHLLEKADKGEIIQIPSDPTKIRILIKLRDYNDTYLLIGRLVDANIIDHIDKANGTAQEYFNLKSQTASLQIKFSIVFILLALILLLSAIIWGRNFAEKLVKPIRELVIAAERVKSGDLKVQVPESGLAKDELKVLSTAFNRMVKQIERQQKELIIAQRALAWSDVARKVAHEIKNPLTPIQLSADRLLKKFQNQVSDKEEFAKYIKNILRHSDGIKTIVSEFVNFARLPAPDFAAYEIVSMISDLVDSRRLINDQITYKFSANAEQVELVCDASQINQVIVNLLKNAEEAFPESQNDRIITLEIVVGGDEVNIIVTDNGIGFSDNIIDSAKNAYVTTKEEGTGLGLAIVERIVQDHYGSLNIANEKGKGAQVRLTFYTKELKTKLK